MGRYRFRLPDVGEGVAEAELVVWHVKPGDTVREDQSLIDVMTDKATVEMTSPVDGVVTATHGEVGAMIPVGSVLVDLEIEGAGETPEEPEAPAAETQKASTPPGGPASTSSNTTQATGPPSVPVPPTPRLPAQRRIMNAVPLASPATRRRAYEAGVPLQFVPGGGPAGRVTVEDLDDYLAHGGDTVRGGDPRYATRDDIAERRIVGLRRRIAERMQEAKRRIPHIAYVEEIDVTQLEALRQDLNAHRGKGQAKLTLLPFFIRALVRALPEFPQINARYDDDAGVLHEHAGVHVGIATQTDGGLMVPVVRHAESRDVWALAAEIGRVTGVVRDGSATREELAGSTITITSLGTLGGIATTPVINYPEVAIVGPNKIVERPVVNGSFVAVRKMMNLSSSFDHRIVDGYDAAQFVQHFKRMLEHPALIFMDAPL